MKYLWYLPFLLCLFLIRPANAQTGREADINFMLAKLRTVYAGYADKVKPGEFQRLIEELRASKSTDSFLLYSRLTGYFRDDHLAVFAVLVLSAADSSESQANLDLIARGRQGTAVQSDNGARGAMAVEKDGGARGATAVEKDGGARGGEAVEKDGAQEGHHGREGLSEGYWLDELGNELLYIRQTSKDRWEGDVVETKAKVPLGLRVLTLHRENTGWLADYRDAYLGYRVVIPAQLKSPGVLVGRCYFKYRKIAAYKPGMLDQLPSFSYEPSATRLDSQTLLIRMPYFESSYAKAYDSLVKANAEALGRVSTLILDIRNNPGGVTRCFSSLRPYICTGPIHESDAWELCSADLIADARGSLVEYEKRKDSGRIERQKRYIDSITLHRDSMWFQKGADSPCVVKPNSIKRVAILMDHGSRSAAELMVLYFRQSSKVRLFGENTGGAIDYLDLLTYELPGSKFQFWVATSKRVCTDRDPAFDSQGIPPDVRIPETEPDWVAYLQNYYRTTTGKP